MNSIASRSFQSSIVNLLHHNTRRLALSRSFQVVWISTVEQPSNFSWRPGVGQTSSVIMDLNSKLTETEDTLMDAAKEIFRKGVEAVHPRNLIKNQISRNGNILCINKAHSVALDKFSGVFVVGFGKAVLPMAEELLQFLGSNLKTCVLSVPVGTRQPMDSRIELHRGAKNNIPDEDAFKSAQRIVEVTSSCSSNDLLLILISGGGSALLPFPKSPITVSEKSELVKLLSRMGADIQEMNTIRRKISEVKGGGLLKRTNAGKVVTLILSDVLGDDLDTIASGPTTVPHRGRGDALSPLQVIQKYLSPLTSLPVAILKAIQEEEEPCEVRGNDGSTDKSERVTNVIIGNNKIALDAAAKCALDALYVPIVLTSLIEGEAAAVGTKISQLCDLTWKEVVKRNQYQTDSIFKNLAKTLFQELNVSEEKVNQLVHGIQQVTNQPKTRGLCLLFGGETTVRVIGSGCGGRNQELALSGAITLNKISPESHIVVCSGGTDGIDGPCDAAGALVTPTTVTNAEKMGISATDFLKNNDSYNFFKSVANGKFHLVTGHTETNVMDIIICIIPKMGHSCSLRNSSL